MIRLLDKLYAKIFNLPLIRRYPTLQQLAKFSSVGIINTTLDFSVYYSLTRTVDWFARHYLTANFIAFLAANILSFFANKYWTFKQYEKNYFQQYLKFFTMSLITLVAIQSTMYLFITVWGWFDIWAKLVALLISTSLNFFGLKFWAFKHSRNDFNNYSSQK